MNGKRFGGLTTSLYLITAMIGASVVGVFAFNNNLAAKIITTFAWVAFCVLVLESWFYPRPKAPVYNTKERYVDIDLSCSGFYMNNSKDTIVIEVLFNKRILVLSVYENKINGWGKACNGLNETLVQVTAGDFKVERTDNGFRLSWTDRNDWKLGKLEIKNPA